MLPGHCPQSSQNPVNYVRAQALEPKGLGSNPAPDHPLAELPWAGAFTSLCLSVHICKMGMVTAPASQSCHETATHLAPGAPKL